MRTHYQNLKIAENAPDEVIRASYRALSHRHHPDKNPENKDAGRIMQILNDAYEILTDPDQRREYDEFLAKERKPTPPVQLQQQIYPKQPPLTREQQNALIAGDSFWMATLIFILEHPILLLIPIMGGMILINFTCTRMNKSSVANPTASVTSRPKPPSVTSRPKPPSVTSRPKPPSVAPQPKSPSFVRPATAPNGESWPPYAAYIGGYPVLFREGLSSITVDNTRNNTDIFVKLVSAEYSGPVIARTCFIPANGQFEFRSVTAGRYDVRYRDLSSGSYFKTEAFTLTETRTSTGTEFSNLSLTIYKVANGNMQTETISEAEF